MTYDRYLRTFADAICPPDASETDHITILEAVRPLMLAPLFKRLCDILEVCPVHICDYRICRDDDLSCQRPR